MDLTLTVGNASISSNRSSYQKAITVEMDDIDKQDLNTVEVAKCIDIERYIEAIGEDVLKEHFEQYYDWFKEKE